MVARRSCTFLMPDGRAWRAGPQRDRPFCFAHDPERAEEAAAARRWAESFGTTADRCTITDRGRIVAEHVRDTAGDGARWYRSTKRLALRLEIGDPLRRRHCTSSRPSWGIAQATQRPANRSSGTWGATRLRLRGHAPRRNARSHSCSAGATLAARTPAQSGCRVAG